VVDPDGRLPFGAEHRIAFTICDADMGFDAIVLCEAPSLLEFELEAPDGTLVDPGVAGAEPTIEYDVDDHLSFYRVALPALRAIPMGLARTWQIVLRLIGAGRSTSACSTWWASAARADCPTARSCTATRTSPSTRT